MMEYEQLITKLIESRTEETLSDAFELIKNGIHEDEITVLDKFGRIISTKPDPDILAKVIGFSSEIRHEVLQLLRNGHGTELLDDIYWRTLLLEAPYVFDSYCLYIERDRELNKRFYQPRRKQLKCLADSMQRLEDDELDLLAISLPPGVGKTTLAIFFICWASGKYPELQNLIGSHNNEFLRGVYDECLRVLDPNGEYRWNDVFPTVGISGTNAKDLRIDLGERKRFQTIQLSSIGSGNAGKIRATNILYCDDLVEGIEQAMSKDQMDKLWSKYTVDLRQRMQGDRVKELIIATRWSLIDPIGRLEQIYGESPRAEFINLPAIDTDGNSNFDYPYGLGFSSDMYRDLEQSMDDASFKALYMGEPIEREGQLYAPTELRRYFELPEREPDAIFAVCDTKEQGDDFCSMPICYQYGTDFYIDDFICDNGKPDIIQTRIVNKICDKHINMIRFESNRGGTLFAQNVQNLLKERGSHCRVTTKWNQTNKETRILVASSWVKEHCLFKDESLYAKELKEYRTAMNFLTGYTMSGKNKHDDVPDSMADLENFVGSWQMNRVEVFNRPF